MSAQPYAELDQTCLSSLENEIAPNFTGLNGVKLQSPSFVLGSDDRATLLIYPGATFQSELGDAQGTLNCIYQGNSTRIWTISVAFEGLGLAGSKKHPLAKIKKDPAALRTLSFAKDIY